MIYNLSTILNEIMKQAREKSNERARANANTNANANAIALNKIALNKIALNKKIFDINLANLNSLIKYNTIQKSKFSVLDTCTSIELKNKNKNLEIYKNFIKKKGLFIIGGFCAFLASFTYLNLFFNYNFILI
jgi:hypothetical protein